MSKGPQRIRGTQDIWGEEADRFHTVVEAFDRVRRLYAFQRVEMPVFESDRGVRPLDRRDHRHRLQGDVHLRGPRRRHPHLAPRIHRRHLPRLSLRRLAAARAAEARHPRPGLPLRAAAEGPLPPVPPARRRDHRHGRARRRRRAARPGRPAAARARHRRRRRRCSSTRSATRRRATPGARRWSRISRRIAASFPRTAARGSSKNPLRILDSKEPRDRPIADAAPGIDDFLTPRRRAFFARGHRRARRRRRRLDAQSAAGARPRLLPPHRLRVRHRPARRAGRGDRRRPL